ncbi:MAG TPA: T9SS type A sorting domain-containing protein [Saprospiraceae bacterium]|nr:T9SS type A sorting domain-containing protein [Saprospiraceae bacterium]
MKVDENGIITSETVIPPIENLLVYPNPAQDYIQFDLPTQSGQVSLELIDLSGRVVLTQKITHQEPIDISFLPKGVYGYRVMGRNGVLIGVGKLVVE